MLFGQADEIDRAGAVHRIDRQYIHAVLYHPQHLIVLTVLVAVRGDDLQLHPALGPLAQFSHHAQDKGILARVSADGHARPLRNSAGKRQQAKQ